MEVLGLELHGFILVKGGAGGTGGAGSEVGGGFLVRQEAGDAFRVSRSALSGYQECDWELQDYCRARKIKLSWDKISFKGLMFRFSRAWFYG